MKKNINNIMHGTLVIAMVSTMTACSDNFLEQKPLSFYEPSNT